jgi:hypothetical protein
LEHLGSKAIRGNLRRTEHALAQISKKGASVRAITLANAVRSPRPGD